MSKSRLRELIHDELVRRGYCAQDDAVFSEFVELMYTNRKPREAIDAELSELLGAEYESSFSEWLFRVAGGGDGGGGTDGASNSASAPPRAPSPPRQQQHEERGPSSRQGAQQRGVGESTDAMRRVPPHMLNGGRNTTRANSNRAAPSAARADGDAQSPQAPARRSGPPRELFASALNGAHRRSEFGAGAKRTMAMRSPSPTAQDEARTRKRAAMDDPSLGESSFVVPDFEGEERAAPPARQVRIRGVGSSNVPASAPASGQFASDATIPKGPKELFPARVPNASSAPVSRPVPTAPSIFQRTRVPDPNAPAFVPQQSTSSDQPMKMDSSLDGPTATSQQASATPHYNPLFFGGGVGGTSAPLTQPPLAARLSAMMPDNPPLPATSPFNAPHALPPKPTNDLSEFPTAPLDVSLCKYDLKCTNPLCRFSHATPSAAHSAHEADALVLKQEACAFGPRCARRECVYSHPSPAVAVAYARAGMLAGPSVSSSSAAAAMSSHAAVPATMPVHMTPAQMRCRWQGECKNASCPYQHFDQAGKPVPPPLASGGAAPNSTSTSNKEGKKAAEEDGKEAKMEVEKAPDGKPAAIDRALDDVIMSPSKGALATTTVAASNQSGKRCKWGAECVRPDCIFGHPPTRRRPFGAGAGLAFSSAQASPAASSAGDAGSSYSSGGAVPCRYGVHCFRADCFFAHPPGRALGVGGGGAGVGMVTRQFALPADAPVETILPKVSST